MSPVNVILGATIGFLITTGLITWQWTFVALGVSVWAYVRWRDAREA